MIILASVGGAHAASGANTRWYNNVNERSAIVREGGTFRVVDRQSGYVLYDDGYCRKIGRSDFFVVTARRLQSKLIYFCTRALPRSAKWAWTEAEFHLSSENGRDVWRLLWVNPTATDGRKIASVVERIKTARIVPEISSYDKLLDGIPCTVTFEKIGDGRELLRPNSPFGDCALGRVKDGAIGTGEFACEAGVDATFLAKRPTRIVNRGDIKAPELYLVVEGRQPQRCKIEPARN